MPYRPSINKLGTFASRLEEGLCLGHVGDGLYKVLDKNKVVRTKHVKADETAFTELEIFKGTVQPLPTVEDDQQFQELDQSPDDSVAVQASSAVNEQDVVGSLTHVPAEPTIFGESDEHDMEDTGSRQNDVEVTNPPYDLRERSPINYSCLAQSDVVADTGDPKLSVAIKSSSSEAWLKAI